MIRSYLLNVMLIKLLNFTLYQIQNLGKQYRYLIMKLKPILLLLT